jgi:hypothetical protein
MCKQCGSKDSAEFLARLRSIASMPNRFLSPMGSVKAFLKLIKLSSITYTVGVTVHTFCYDGFGGGWDDAEFKWVIRHLVNNPQDIEPARNIMLQVSERNQRLNECQFPWFGGKQGSL